jgi:CelD/BcsL family acetyltransferase involved in cellulose biosynthesis
MVRERAKTVSKVTNLYVSWHDYETWESYYRSLKKSDRSNNERRQRRLGERGRVTFKVIEGAQCAPAIDWALANKVKQLAQTNRRGGHWLKTKAYRNLLVWAASRGSPRGRLVMFVLKLDDQLIATLLCRVDQIRIESLNTVYDAAYSQYGPGVILRGECLKWAFERQLDFDMRGWDLPHKRRWANRESSAINYEVANSTSYALCIRYPALMPLLRSYRVGKHRLGQYLADEWRTRRFTPNKQRPVETRRTRRIQA